MPRRRPLTPFQVSCPESLQYGYDEGRPPSSAKLVAQVSWGWAPGHDRCERYVICTDRRRTAWTLWGIAFNDEDGRLMYAKLAYGSPFSGYTAKICRRKASNRGLAWGVGFAWRSRGPGRATNQSRHKENRERGVRSP
jgi:hypothetical protein